MSQLHQAPKRNKRITHAAISQEIDTKNTPIYRGNNIVVGVEGRMWLFPLEAVALSGVVVVMVEVVRWAMDSNKNEGGDGLAWAGWLKLMIADWGFAN